MVGIFKIFTKSTSKLVLEIFGVEDIILMMDYKMFISSPRVDENLTDKTYCIKNFTN